MQIRCTRLNDAVAIAEALAKLYPAYHYEAFRERGCRTFTIRVFCRATGALLMTRAEI